MVDFRLAEDSELPALAELRWLLQTDDQPIANPSEYERFIGEFVRIGASEPRRPELFHWVAADGNRLVGAMSVVIVQKVPGPTTLRGRWGYLTNCYVRPEARNDGVGSGLLSTIKAWASDLGLELLVVWPSEHSYSFYERAGFRRRPDPLVFESAPSDGA